MDKKIGFIGCGKMAQAIIGGMLNSGIARPDDIVASARTESTLAYVKNTYDIEVTLDNKRAAEQADFLFLAVKPDVHMEVIEEISGSVPEDAIIITIAAGISLAFLKSAFGREVKAIRSMPNTPSLVGEGMSALAASRQVTEKERLEAAELFKSFGKAEFIEEKLMDSIPAISGSSPAYVYMFIEALADGGVLQGLPRETSYRLAAQAVLGAAKMVLETGKHPGELKDQVCTPGGATIEAVAELEKQGFRSSVISAMQSCADKSKQLAKKQAEKS
ncbi:pyrroline-5-carboxylate reductase [Bacillus infantis]|uniref:pyrroline-5-carboxylate reductase n=1 Tax=Bacillus infantis TaxID=324767 RepID=UPI003CF6463C